MRNLVIGRVQSRFQETVVQADLRNTNLYLQKQVSSFNSTVSRVNPLRPNSDQTSHCNIKGLSVREVMRIENMIIQVKFY